MTTQPNTSLESALALDDEGGHWVTINSVHVHVKGGVIDQGPAHIEGRSLEQAAKEGYAVTAIHGAEKPTGQKFTPEQFKQLKTRIKKIMDEGAQKYAYVSHSKALAQAKKEMGLSDDSFILQLDDIGEGKPLPLGLSGLPTTDDAGQPIHYRKMLVARCGDWHHVGTGEKLPITRERADEWVRNGAKLSDAGRRAFIPTHHTFSDPDAEHNQGYVLNVSREGDDVYATVALHGDEALKIAARNSRSIGIKRNPLDASGNQYSGEWLHHLALVPNPALPHLGGMTQIAASADGFALDVPVFELTASHSSAPSRKGHHMKPENAQHVRAKLGIGADVPDDQLDDKTAERALWLSAENTLYTSVIADLKAERDAAKAEATAKASEVLALSADKRDIDPITMSMFSENISTKREMAIKSGAISEAEAKSFDAILNDAAGQPSRLALSASGPAKRPLGFQLWDAIAKLGNNGLRTGTERPAGTFEATPSIALSDDASNDEIAKKAKAQASEWRDLQLSAQGKA